MSALGTDTGSLGTDLQALAADEQDGLPADSDMSAAQSDAAMVQSDAQALQASPGPSCLPGLASNISAAAKYFNTAAIDADNAVNQLSAGSLGAADGDIVSANTAVDKGNAKISAATTAVQNFSAGSGG
jgi:hypothetical protein